MAQTDGSYSIGSGIWPGLSKLIEEMGELQQVIGKLIGHRADPFHWDGTDLIERMEEEMGDVIGALQFVGVVNPELNRDRILARAEQKCALFSQWHTEQGTS